MSDNSYFVGHNSPKHPIEYDDGKFLLEAPYHLPLLWIACCSTEEMADFPAERKDGQRFQWMGATFSKVNALDRLKNKAQSSSVAFSELGDLKYHFGIFSKWLEKQPFMYFSVNWTEYVGAGLNEASKDLVFSAIKELEEGHVSKNGPASIASTLIPNTPLITLEHAMQIGFTEDEKANFFRIFGDRHSVEIEVDWM
jgi:hypothetical protein